MSAAAARAQPLVRIEHDRIRLLDPRPQRAELGADHRRPGRGGIDVHGQPVRAGHRDTGADPVEGAGRGAARTEDHAHRQEPRRAVRPDGRIERGRVHRQAVAGGHLDQIVLADARHARGPVHAGMRLGAGTSRRAGLPASPARFPAQPSARSRIVSTADRVAAVAGSWIVPRKCAGNPSACASRRHITCSISIAAAPSATAFPARRWHWTGHRRACWPTPRWRGNRRRSGGCCQCVIASDMIRAKSAEIRSIGSGDSGGASGNCRATLPGDQRRPHRAVAQGGVLAVHPVGGTDGPRCGSCCAFTHGGRAAIKGLGRTATPCYAPPMTTTCTRICACIR